MKTGGLVSLLCIGVCVGILVTFQMEDVVVEQSLERVRSWGALGDADPGGDLSGFMYFMVYPHQADPGTAYASNLSNATAYEYSDSLNTEMTGETPSGTTFDFVCKIRVNDTVGYNTSTSVWETTWQRINITVDFQVSSDVSKVAMTLVEIGNNTDFCWYHGYAQDDGGDAGSGFTITKNEKYNVTSLECDGYW